MSGSKSIRVGTYGVPITFKVLSEEIDLRNVQSATLSVGRPGLLEEGNWTCTLSDAAEKTLTLTYILQQGDLEKSGTYRPFARLALVGGHVWETDVDPFEVTRKHER